MKKIATILLATACSLTACDIERLPYGSLAAEEITKDPQALLTELVNGSYAQLKDWSDPMHRCGEYAGDNMMKDKHSTDAFFDFISYNRSANNYRLNSFWNGGYKAIAQASNVITMIEEGQTDEIDYKLGECFFIRGLMYFYFVRAYGRPYYQAPDKNLGVPIVNGTPDNISDMYFEDRATVKECYAQAIGDMENAIRLMEKGKTSSEGPAYASKEAAWAVLSRIYLYMSGTYENPNTEYAQKAVDYATKVIDSEKYHLLSREDFMVYNTFTPENNDESIFVVKRMASEKPDYWNTVGGMYSQAGGQGWAEMFASAKYIDLLNEGGRNDWRPDKKNIIDARANFIAPQYVQNEDGTYTEVFRFIKNLYNEAGEHTGYAYVQAPLTRNGRFLTCKDGDQNYTLALVNEADEKYSIQYKDGQVYTGVVDYKMGENVGHPRFYIMKCSSEGTASGTADSQLHSPVISRLGEVYMNRAEAYAKLGQYGSALIDLNKVRERSIVGGGYASLDASNARERIEKERQLELAYQAERSYDVFRNGGRLTRHYPGIHNAMLEVEPTDFRVVYFIPQDAINAYPGILTQNPTNNGGVILN